MKMMLGVVYRIILKIWLRKMANSTLWSKIAKTPHFTAKDAEKMDFAAPKTLHFFTFFENFVLLKKNIYILKFLENLLMEMQ